MANHCYNHIEITNVNSVEIEKIKKWIKTYKDFNYLNDWVNSIIDIEHQLTPNHEENGDPREYGARWFDVCNLNETEDSITISGDSAWSPMTGLCKALSSQFECDIQIDFQESGCDFGGQDYYSCGNKSINFEGSYREYLYWNEGYDVVENENSWVETVEELEDCVKEWLVIIKEPEDKAKLLNWYQEKLTEFKTIKSN